jgi:ubiquinone/menaquinone biosynthesis C-methylase UbiE
LPAFAAERVGDEGAVTGLDFNPAMIAVAESAVPDPSIEWREANAETIPLPDNSFDVVVCSLGLQFVASKEAALREMHRVLTYGGRVAVGTVAPTPVFKILERPWRGTSTRRSLRSCDRSFPSTTPPPCVI